MFELSVSRILLSLLTINQKFVSSFQALSACLCIPIFVCGFISVTHLYFSLTCSVTAFVSQSPALSVSISLCLPASYESVLVLTGLAMGCFAKGSGAEHLTIVRVRFHSASRWQEEKRGTIAEIETFFVFFFSIFNC